MEEKDMNLNKNTEASLENKNSSDVLTQPKSSTPPQKPPQRPKSPPPPPPKPSSQPSPQNPMAEDKKVPEQSSAPSPTDKDEEAKQQESAKPEEEKDDVIEKNYKAGLSDQDREKRKRRRRRLLLLLLLLLLLGGIVTSTYFIIKNKTEYVPEFYDNVAMELEYEMQAREDGMPGDTLLLLRPVEVFVKANTEEINYDIVALGFKVTAKFADSGEDCSDIIDVGLCDKSQLYVTDQVKFVGDNYVRAGKDLMFYYNKVLEPGENEKLINALRISPKANNSFAKREIIIKVEVYAVYPNPVQIRADNSYFTNAPEGWVEHVYSELQKIFKERAKNK